jgi:hypothetical protein
MATTTPNFGWPVPTSTDLVKDGATAIEALGDGVDASMVDLKGGLTGQVLAKTTNADMDFTWVTTDDANAIQNSIVDAKGDLISATANDTPARLAVGNNGETLVADSSTSTGLRYQQPKTFNTVINGNFDWWQRGTSFAGLSTYAYTADRWKVVLSGTSLNATLSQDTSVPNVRSKYSAKLQQLTSSATSVSEFGFHQIFETSTILPLCGNTVTLSFWYKSGITGTHYYRIYTAYQTGGVDTTSTFTVTAADTWEYKTITLSAFASITAVTTALTAAGTELQIGPRVYGSGGTSTIAINGYAQISQVQMEVGSVATPFARAGGTIQGELAACQRYYWPLVTAINQTAFNGGYVTSATQILGTIQFPVTMRVAPTASITTGTNFWYAGVSGSFTAFSGSWGTDTTTVTATNIYINSAPTSTVGASTQVRSYSSGSAALSFSAEL